MTGVYAPLESVHISCSFETNVFNVSVNLKISSLEGMTPGSTCNLLLNMVFDSVMARIEMTLDGLVCLSKYGNDDGGLGGVFSCIELSLSGFVCSCDNVSYLGSAYVCVCDSCLCMRTAS